MSASDVDQHVFSLSTAPVQVDVEEIEDGGIAEPNPGVGDKVQAAAEAVAVAEQPERELHSFEIDPAQVHPGTQSASRGSRSLSECPCIHCSANSGKMTTEASLNGPAFHCSAIPSQMAWYGIA